MAEDPKPKCDPGGLICMNVRARMEKDGSNTLRSKQRLKIFGLMSVENTMESREAGELPNMFLPGKA